MPNNLNLKTQLIIIGSIFAFFYIFFALTTSIYRDYSLENHIQSFQNDIQHLEDLVYKKPDDIEYFQSLQFKDKYAKENLNLINPGEKLIIIPKDDQVIRPEVVVDQSSQKEALLKSPNPNQWWAYFFGQTLSVGN